MVRTYSVLMTPYTYTTHTQMHVHSLQSSPHYYTHPLAEAYVCELLVLACCRQQHL